MRETLLAVDGNSLMHRAFHALPLMDADGVYTNAVHGFLSMLFKAIQDLSPRYIAVAFDEHAPTFRHTAYPEYKAGRRATPDELRPQFPVIREILGAMGVGVLSVAGYEADDILGTLSRLCAEHDINAVLLTGDRDALQLVTDDVKLLFTRKGISETTLFTPASVKEYFGVTPAQVTDWKGLMGDSSDNIPGVPGVGEKRAVALLNEFGTLENVLKNADHVKGKLGESLRANADLALFCKDLATIRPTAPIDFDLSAFDSSRIERGLPALRKYKLNGIAQRMEKLLESAPSDAPEDAPTDAPPLEVLSTGDDIARFIGEIGGVETAIHVTPQTLSIATDTRLAQVTLAGDLMNPGLTPREALLQMKPLFEKQLIVHDGKRLRHLLDGAGIPAAPFLFDTVLGAYLINPQEKSYALNAFAEENAFGVIALSQKQRRAIKEKGMEALMATIEAPLMTVLYDMERDGFRVDGEVLRALGRQYTSESERLREEVYALSGVRGFNLNSPQQLGKVLFEELKLQAGKKTQRGYSTDADTLEKLIDAHPCIAPILKYRQVVKLNGTYIDGLLRKMDASGRIHSYFDQTGTATGRISSSEPNLQNIPVRTEMGREIRRAFIAREGWMLVDADYSQIELRLLAHLSGDRAMIGAFTRGEDIHTRTAAEVYDVPMEDVTGAMRSSAKAVNFGLVYGISEFGLARNIGVSRREAADFIARYFARYPGVKRYMDESVRVGYDRGYAETLMGRRRPLPELKSSNANIRAFGERAAMNTPVQGTAADVIKLAMIRVHDALEKSGLRARLILQVHDELLLEAPEDEVSQAKALLKDCMENALKLSVPLIADVGAGESWFQAK